MSAQLPGRYLDRQSPPAISTLIILTGLAALSMNLFLPSLPNMAEDFGVDYRLMQLSVTLYLAMNAVLQLFVGPFSDRFGRRPVILWSFLLFSLATVGCILAPNAQIFLAFRVAQAVVVAGLVLGRAVVRDMVPGPQAASMIGYVTMGMAVVPMLGPGLGGVLDEAFGWRANFGLLLILGLGVMALVWADLGETIRQKSTSFGAQFREYPELLRSPRFWGYCATASTASGAFFAYLGGAPFVAAEVFGLSTAQVGYYFGAPALGYFVGNFLSGRLTMRVGMNRMILWGSIISTLGMCVPLFLAMAGVETALIFFASVTTVGVGNGMVLPSANAGMLSVRPHLAGSASGLGGAIMIGGGAALADISGGMLSVESGALPLIAIMFITSALSILAILATMWRERQITGQ